jgi:hypothetical protein
MLGGIDEIRKFHSERRDRTVSVTCEKSSVPMLWLDSSVLIDFAKIQKGENIERARAAKLSRLRQVARKAVRAEKLVCPEWDQALEFEGKRLEPQIRKIVSDLSCGAHCIPYYGVKDHQVSHGLKAYLAMADFIHIPASIHFYEDPASVVRQAKRDHCIVEADIPKPAEWITKAAKDKLATQKELEVLRQKQRGKKQTFERQLALERIGESDVMLKMLANFKKNVVAGKIDLWDVMGVEGYHKHLNWWRQMGGPGMELAGIYSFMRSPYYWELPIEDVACRLSADLLVRHSEVTPGDSQDVDHLATAIPVAHYIVADKAMADRCERLSIGSKWNTKLFSTRTLDDLW